MRLAPVLHSWQPLRAETHAVTGRTVYMFEYSGPLPPSGGVSRPPLAVIAPHCTQFDGASFSCTVGPPSSRPISQTAAGHIATHASATSRGTFPWTRMWLGWSSRLRLPERNTLESLSNVSFPSGAGYTRLPGCGSTDASASLWNVQLPGGSAPRLMFISPPIGPPSANPLPSAWRMFLRRLRSLQLWLACTRWSYPARASGADMSWPAFSCSWIASAASIPERIA